MAFLGGMEAAAVKGEIAGNPPQKGGEDIGPLGRHNIPGPKPGIADAFLGVLPACKDIAGNGGTVGAVLFVRCTDGRLVPVPVQSDDLVIFHDNASFHPERHRFRRNLTVFFPVYHNSQSFSIAV